MSYATVEELVAEFGEAELIDLTDRADPPNGTVDATVAQRALDAAGEVIDGYLAARYAVPLSPVPGIVKTIALDLARAALYTNAMPETVALRRRAQIDMLKALNTGAMQIGATTTAAPTVEGLVQVETSEKVFSRGARGL